MIADYEFSSKIEWGASNTAIASVEIICESYEGLNQFPFARVELWDPKASAPEAVVTKQFSRGSYFCSGVSKANDIVGVDPFESEVDQPVSIGSSKTEVTFVVKDPRLWCTESPELYILVISLHATLADAESGAATIDAESCRVAFREVFIGGEDNQLMVNRTPITIAGVNRHEFHPVSGRSVSESSMREDAAIMKRFNFNAVRCAHYPNHHRWLEICDEAGLYVVDEANIETHGFQMLGQPVNYLSNLRSWRGAHFSRLVRMVERDKNHGCVILWSLGNESGLGTSHKLMAQWVRARDQRRYVQYEAGGARSDATDIVCPMYQRPWWCRKQAVVDRGRRPVILCEYAHAMGNSGGSFFKYWRDFRDPLLPRLQGGFIWDFVDQGIALSGGKFGYGGDFGDLPNTKQFCINGLFGPDRRPHPTAYEAKTLQAPLSFELVEDGSGALLLVVSCFSREFNMDGVSVHISLGCDTQTSACQPIVLQFPGSYLVRGQPVMELFTGLRTRAADEISKLLAIDADALSRSSEVWIHIKARTSAANDWVPAHHELAAASLTHPLLSRIIFERVNRPPSAIMPSVSPIVSEKEGMLIIEWGSSSKVTIGTQCGRLLLWEYDSKRVITKPLDTCIWRAPTDNVSALGFLLEYLT